MLIPCQDFEGFPVFLSTYVCANNDIEFIFKFNANDKGNFPKIRGIPFQGYLSFRFNKNYGRFIYGSGDFRRLDITDKRQDVTDKMRQKIREFCNIQLDSLELPVILRQVRKEQLQTEIDSKQEQILHLCADIEQAKKELASLN